MFSNETIRKLREIHMGVMAEQLSAQLEDPQFRNVPFEDRLAMLVDAEWSARKSNRLTGLIKKAGYSRLFLAFTTAPFMPIVDGETDGARLQDLLASHMKQVLRRILIQIFPFYSTFRLRRLDENGRNLYNYICSPLNNIIVNINSIRSVKNIVKKLETMSAGGEEGQKVIAESLSRHATERIDCSESFDVLFDDFGLTVGGKDIIKHFTFHFETGKKYLIVGLNGSGKSTLFKALKNGMGHFRTI